uniref:Uncharacterized protein n=1 Tax=Plectus sambesii TaxID=2011161 RepID=A0A914VVG5_9BILA
MEEMLNMTLIWSINHCLIQNGRLLTEGYWSDYYSCGVDSVIDLLDYAMYTNLSEVEIQNKSKLLQLLYECHQMREKERRTLELMRPNLSDKAAALRQLLQHRLKISWNNNIVWDWLCIYDRQNWCEPMRGTAEAQLHGIPISLIETEYDKALFGLSLLWKRGNEQCGD